jgi:hypothetical protein
MNVEIGTEAVQFPEKEYINGTFVTVYAFIRGSFCFSAMLWKCTHRMAWVQIPKYVFRYEPLYVARANTPLFDERFVGFGMTRNSQVRQMIHIFISVEKTSKKYLKISQNIDCNTEYFISDQEIVFKRELVQLASQCSFVDNFSGQVFTHVFQPRIFDLTARYFLSYLMVFFGTYEYMNIHMLFLTFNLCLLTINIIINSLVLIQKCEIFFCLEGHPPPPPTHRLLPSPPLAKLMFIVSMT